MILNLSLGGLPSVMAGILMVAVGYVGMVGCGLMFAGFVMLCRLLMMSRGMLVMFGCSMMIICCLF